VPSKDQLPVDPITDLPTGYEAHEVEAERDVLDTWATSSVSPQLNTRAINDEFALNDEALENHKRQFPMALRPQAHEIIRTWAFYTIVKALHHENAVPWKEIAISGWCLASDGSKMSKSKGNVIDPIKLLDEYGTDPVRYWTGTSRLGQDTALSPNTLKQGKRLVTKLWNAVKLAAMSLEGADQTGVLKPTTPKADIESGVISHPLDQWLLGELSATIAKATEAFENYEYAAAQREIEDFFWRTYCDNYLEIVKRRTRFEGQPEGEDLSAVYTLWHATDALIRLLAPFIPYVTDALYDIVLLGDGMPSTVHARGMWPKAEDQAQTGVFKAEGEAFVQILSAARKVKSEAQVSMKTAANTLTIAVEGEGSVSDLIGATEDDLKAVTSADAIVRASVAPEGVLSAASQDERFTISMDLIIEDKAES